MGITEFWMDKTLVSPNRLIGRHWAAKHRERDEWMVWLRAALTPEQLAALREASGCAHPANHFGAQQMRVEIHVVQPSHLFDEDNLEVSLKPLLDAMKAVGLIWNDSPRWLLRPRATQELAKNCCRSDGKPGTRVRIGKCG